ncbi:hypothetical protein SD70_00040 [Gordoniibacillus kamchatkensis]|uniref:Uncharacterized protein n=1 Tax=Gordoniibacillus kamchatkensis TaxID=1590651 RepID=A0ABR5AMX2_9BACL|nr:hypothetical protein [Paenibacillus sp. VKM B-2647]KIL42377.1 hypothetical protein SD70_00040 [Paenibacillus sp. VKM B-2647]
MDESGLLNKIAVKVNYNPREIFSKDDPFYLEKCVLKHPRNHIGLHFLAQKYEQEAIKLLHRLKHVQDHRTKMQLAKKTGRCR